MQKKIILISVVVALLLIGSISLLHISKNKKVENSNKLEAMVMSTNGDSLVVQDKDNIIYRMNVSNLKSVETGDSVLIKYVGVLDKNSVEQDVSVIDYKTTKVSADFASSMFSKYYKQAQDTLNKLTLDEKIGQMFLVRVPENNKLNVINDYKIGGYLLFERDFKDKTKKEVVDMINSFQDASKIPLLIATDEEGGKVVRVSSNPNLRSTPFKSAKELYDEGGMDLIKKDTEEKSKLLSSLGVNVNLAPVVDVSTDPSDYMYPRTIGEDTKVTSEYASDVINASKTNDVSYVLKHFPGYGNNKDTHTGSSVDSRSYEDIINNDIPPFNSGIKAGAEATLVSHNIVNSIDSKNPASLSTNVHNLLRNQLDFSGVIITDDLAMSALNDIDEPVTKAILAGNDIMIVTDYENNINEVKDAINKGKINENIINNIALKIIAWKYYKGLMLGK